MAYGFVCVYVCVNLVGYGHVAWVYSKQVLASIIMTYLDLCTWVVGLV